MGDASYYVYIHRRESNGLAFYVGKGKGDRAWRTNGRNSYWERTRKKHGIIVEIITDKLTESAAMACEIAVIDELRGVGCKLTNMTDGGDGTSGYKFSDESKRRMSESNAFRRPEVIEIIANLRRGKKQSEEARKKISMAGIGRKQSPETIAKRVAHLKGKKFSKEHLENLSKAHMGYVHSPESRAKMSLSRKGNKISEECKKKISEANKKPVICSNGMRFDGTIDAELWLKSIGRNKAKQSNISSCCSGRLKSAYGFTWKMERSQKS